MAKNPELKDSPNQAIPDLPPEPNLDFSQPSQNGRPSSSNPSGGETLPNPEPEEEKTAISRMFLVVSNLVFGMLLLSLAALLGMSLFVLDFLDILQFRYKIPENIRKKWPLSAYFDFVRLNQLPDEERYKILLQRQKEMYDTLISEGSSDLKKRAEELDSKYRELVRAQEDLLKKRQGDLAKLQEENIKEKKRLDDLNQDVSKKKEIADALSKQVASEALNLESSLIRFMEGESRLKAVQEVCASMDPRSIASIFDEVADNMLIYNILKGVPPERSALVLSFMDPEKAGKIIKMSTNLPTLPGPNESRSYMPPSLKNLLASSQSLLR